MVNWMDDKVEKTTARSARQGREGGELDGALQDQGRKSMEEGVNEAMKEDV